MEKSELAPASPTVHNHTVHSEIVHNQPVHNVIAKLEYGVGLLIEALNIFDKHVDMLGLTDTTSVCSIHCGHQDFFGVFDRPKITFRKRGSAEYPWEAIAFVRGVCFFTLVNKTVVFWLIENKLYTATELCGLLIEGGENAQD